MKKILLILGALICAVLGLVYLSFLFVIPNVIDLDKYKPEIQKLVKEQIPLNIDFKNAKITTTPLLSVGVKADDISVKFEDGTSLFAAEKAKIRFALPSILVLTVKISSFDVDNPVLNSTIVDGKQFKLLTLIEETVQKSLDSQIDKDETQNIQESWFNPAWIRIKIPKVVFNNYKIQILDEKTGHNLKLQGENLRLGYFNGKTVKLKTNAELFADDKKRITANIDINTFLPNVTNTLDEEDDKPEKIELPFMNPVLMYEQYNLESNISAKLKVREKNGLYKLNGFLNIDDTTLNLSGYQLPKCFFHSKFRGYNGNLDTIIAVAKNENLAINGNIGYGKHKNVDLTVSSDKIYFNDLIILAKAYLDSLHIRNQLNEISGKGYIEANASIKSNADKLISNGKISIKDGAVLNRHINLGLDRINANLILENNALIIKDTYTYINKSLLKVDGKIDENANADVKILAQSIPISGLYNAFAPKDIKNNYNITSGNVSLNGNLRGKLKNSVYNMNLDLKNLKLSERKNAFRLNNENLKIIIKKDIEKDLITNIINNGLNLTIPQTKSVISCNNIKIDVIDTKTTINPIDIYINKNSKISFNGLINSDKNNSSINLKADGMLDSRDLKQFLGDSKAYFNTSGSIPLSLNVDGNMKRQNMVLKFLSSPSNYITPINIENMKNKNSLLQLKIDFKGNRLKIKETGLFNRIIKTTDDGKNIEELKEIVGISGTIANLQTKLFINVVRISIPETLIGNIHIFRNSGFSISPSKIFVFGDLNSPLFRGNLSVSNLFIRDLRTTMDKLNLNFSVKSLHADIKNLEMNGSDINSSVVISLEPSNILRISNLKVNSNNLDLDKLMMLNSALIKILPQSSNSAPTTNIPVTLTESSINFKKIKTGNIILDNTTSGISLHRNHFYISRLKTRAFGGNIVGNIVVNLINMQTGIFLRGFGINSDKMLIESANMKDTLSGKLSFITNLHINAGASNYNAQMKSLRGNIRFNIENGQIGPFGKLENLILAKNIRESKFFETALGGIIGGLTTIDTTHFKELRGILSFKNGIVMLSPITSKGNVLTLQLIGDYDLLKNTTDIKVRGRLASMVSNLLGPISNINPVNLVKVTPGLNVASAKLFSIFTETVTEEDLKKIPEFDTKTDNFNATKFQVIVRGDVAKPLTLIQSFKWLASQEQINLAQAFVASLPEPDSLNSTVAEVEKEAENDAKKMTKVKNFFKKKEVKAREEQRLETQKELNKMLEDAKNQT